MNLIATDDVPTRLLKATLPYSVIKTSDKLQLEYCLVVAS